MCSTVCCRHHLAYGVNQFRYEFDTIDIVEVIEHFHILKNFYLNRFSIAYNKKTKKNILVIYIAWKLESKHTCAIKILNLVFDSFKTCFPDNMWEKDINVSGYPVIVADS